MSKRKRTAFTLVEIAIAVAIIGLLAAMASLAYMKSSDRAKATTLVNDLRVYSQTFKTYFHETNDYSRSESRGRLYPEGLEERLRPSWNEPSPVGGMYMYKVSNRNNPDRRRAYILIRNINNKQWRMRASNSVLQIVDEELDDGVLSTGNFVRRSKNRIHYYLINSPY